MSLLNDFNSIRQSISEEIVIEDYSSEWLEAYIPNRYLPLITYKLRKIAIELEQKYTRPVHLYVNKSRFMIKLK